MEEKNTPSGRSNMLVTYFIMALILAVSLWLAYKKGVVEDGLRDGFVLLKGIFPLLVVAFFVAGLIGRVLPKELMRAWLGEGSGMKGLVLGTFAGAITPGGPFVQFPIVASLLKAGAGVGPVAAYITSWSLLGLNRFFVYEMPILGFRFASLRFLVSILLPILVGGACQALWEKGSG